MVRRFSDKEIVDSIRQENADLDDVLTFLYDANLKPVMKAVSIYGGSPEASEDIFQDAIIATYHAIREGKFRGQSAVSTYIFAIAKNMALKAARRKERFSFEQIEDHSNVLHEELSENEIDQIPLLRRLIDQLGQDCQVLLLDFYFNKLSMVEIMKKFGLGSEQAAKNKKYRCMKELMTLCKENGLTKESLQEK